jgi:hypothetical protein
MKEKILRGPTCKMQAPVRLSLVSTQPDCREIMGESGGLEETNRKSTEAPCLRGLIVEMQQHVPVQGFESSLSPMSDTCKQTRRPMEGQNEATYRGPIQASPVLTLPHQPFPMTQ